MIMIQNSWGIKQTRKTDKNGPGSPIFMNFQFKNKQQSYWSSKKSQNIYWNIIYWQQVLEYLELRT